MCFLQTETKNGEILPLKISEIISPPIHFVNTVLRRVFAFKRTLSCNRVSIFFCILNVFLSVPGRAEVMDFHALQGLNYRYMWFDSQVCTTHNCFCELCRRQTACNVPHKSHSYCLSNLIVKNKMKNESCVFFISNLVSITFGHGWVCHSHFSEQGEGTTSAQ